MAFGPLVIQASITLTETRRQILLSFYIAVRTTKIPNSFLHFHVAVVVAILSFPNSSNAPLLATLQGVGVGQGVDDGDEAGVGGAAGGLDAAAASQGGVRRTSWLATMCKEKDAVGTPFPLWPTYWSI